MQQVEPSYELEEKMTELEAINIALLSREEQLATLSKVCAEVNRSLDLQETLERALDIMLSSMGMDAGFIFLLNETRKEFLLKAQRGMKTHFGEESVIMEAGRDFPTELSDLDISVQDISTYPRLSRFLREREGLRSFINVPLSANGELLGIINLFSQDHALTAPDTHVLAIIGQQIGKAIENAQLFQKVVCAKKEWEEIFDAITEGIFMIDEDYNILRVNIAFADMVGTTPAKLIGKKCYQVLHNKDVPPDYCPKAETMEMEEPQTIEVREATLEKDLLLSIYPLRNQRGNVDRVVHIVQDITLRKQLQGQLAQAEKLSAIGRLAQGIAHNLLTPLTVIRGRTQLVAEEMQDFFEQTLPPLLRRAASRKSQMPLNTAQTYAEIRQELLAIERGCRTMEDIINNLMYKSRREQEEHKQLIDINDLLWQELKFLDGDPRFKHDINKVYNFCESPLYIEGIYSDFSQAFSNLIRNAIDAMEGCENPVLTITTRCNDNYICVDIHDTGVGIPPENIPHLFEPFFTTKSLNGGNTAGTGLGLHSCYQLLSPYGAKFEVKSRPGDTTFTVKIPRQQCAQR